MEDRHGGILGVRAVAWVVHVLGLVADRFCDDPDELTCLTTAHSVTPRVSVEVEEDRAVIPGLVVDALINVGPIGAARRAEQACICG